MYICVFSRSEGAGSATTRNTRGLTRSVIALIVPPFPAASRPSKITMTRRPLAFTHSWSRHNFACSFPSSSSYSLRVSFFAISTALLRLLPAPAERAIQLRARAQLVAACPRQEELLLEQILVGGQDLEIARKSRVVAGAREHGAVGERVDARLPLSVHVRERLDRHQRVGDLAVSVERGLLIAGDRFVDGGARRLEVVAQTSPGEHGLQQPGRGLPDR